MTRDEILNMPAGREMDALVAEKVMEIEHVVFGREKAFRAVPTPSRGGSVILDDILHYSTRIAAAWQVADYVWVCRVSKHGTGTGVAWGAKIAVGGGGIGEAFASTAPTAICRAALLAVMEVE